MAKIAVTCVCGKRYAVEPRALGGKARCAGCGRWVEFKPSETGRVEPAPLDDSAIAAAVAASRAADANMDGQRPDRVRSDVTPELAARVDELLERNAPFETVLALLGSRVFAVNYVADWAAERFGLDNAGPRCASCGRSPVVAVWQIHWTSEDPRIRKGTHRIKPGAQVWSALNESRSPEIEAEYTGYHGLCDSCDAGLRRNRRLMPVLALSAIGSLLGGVVLLALWKWSLLSHASGPAGLRPTYGLVLIAAGLLMGCVLYVFKLPAALKQVGREPFEMKKARRVPFLG
ncbi:MAG: hypothetical protein JWM97_2828 [Phycisphaerales bacterium]|nr:hypothetical protein [Phycisphaerales bacterium]